MGACVSTEYTPDSISNANLLLSIIRSSGGQIAIYGLCLSVVLACLTTAISQITAVADFYETATHGKLSYKVLVMIVPIVTTIVASFGLDTIVSLTSPWFSFFYPITLVMTILGIFEKKIPNDGAFKGAVYFTVIYAVLDLPHEYGFGFLDPVLNHIPSMVWASAGSFPPSWASSWVSLPGRARAARRPEQTASELYTVLEWNAQSA